MGGVTLDPREQTIKTFVWGLGHKTNNEVEWLVLLQGLEMVNRGTISSLLIFGDSHHVILKKHTGYSAGSINCRKYHDRISHLSLPPAFLTTTF